MKSMSNYITTYTGRHFEPTNPDLEAICIEDIAHALSLITCGNGHVKTFWSVGEHCLCCAKEAAAREEVSSVVQDYPIPLSLSPMSPCDTIFAFGNRNYELCRIRVVKTRDRGFVTTIEEIK